MSTGEGSPSLVAKLAQVMAAVQRIPKRGHNDFHKYDYATEADIAQAIRDELAQRSIAFLPSVESVQREVITNERGKQSGLVTLAMTMTFIDGESGQEITRYWAGHGVDPSDKALYKAITGGVKYFLLKTFMIPTGDDPEQETKAPDAPARQPAKTASKGATAKAKPAATTPAQSTTASAVTVVTKVWPKRENKPCGVVFGDGEKYSTFDDELQAVALLLERSGAPCRYTTQQNGRFTNLATLTALVDADPDDDLDEPPPPTDDELDSIPF